MLTFTLSHPAQGERQIALSPAQLAGEGATIGRTSRNQVVLDDQTVSRTHARITVQQDSTFVTDCGSTSGTALNGTRLASERPMRMTGGDRITIGPFTLTLNTPSGPDTDLMEATIVAAPPLASYMPLADVAPDSFAPWSEGELQVRVQRIQKAPQRRGLRQALRQACRPAASGPRRTSRRCPTPARRRR